MPEPRPTLAGRIALELESEPARPVLWATGGDVYADVVSDPSTTPPTKRLGPVSYRDITLGFTTGMSKRFYQLVTDFLDGTASRSNGAIVELDPGNREVARTTFTDAVTSELSLPALVASSKEQGQMTLTLAPGRTRSEGGSGRVISMETSRAKPWHLSNFRLRIDALNASRVQRVEPLTFRRPLGPGPRPGQPPLQVPNLLVTLPRSAAADWQRWHEDFVIKGNNSRDHEKSGALELLAPDLQTTLFGLTLHGLGIFSLQPGLVDAGAEKVASVRAALYCQKASFSAPSS